MLSLPSQYAAQSVLAFAEAKDFVGLFANRMSFFESAPPKTCDVWDSAGSLSKRLKPS